MTLGTILGGGPNPAPRTSTEAREVFIQASSQKEPFWARRLAGGLLLLSLWLATGSLGRATLPNSAPQEDGAAGSEVLEMVAPEDESDPPESNRVDYIIEARLDGETKRIDGSEKIQWTNRTEDDVSDMWFHLYLNAFSNVESTHLFEGRGKLKSGKRMTDGWGWSRITAARFIDGEERIDLMPSMAFQSPDDGREEDRTVFRLELPRPIAAGETALIEIEWESQLPRVVRRTGYKDDFLLVAQWFPKLGVYEEGKGWYCHQFHAHTEFFSDYGTYDVTLNLPSKYRDAESGEVFVGGSGTIIEKRAKGDDRVIVRMIAPSVRDQAYVDHTGRKPLVHDFTWTADPKFIVHDEDNFQYSDWESQFPGEIELAQEAFGTDIDLSLRSVDIRLLIHPERKDQIARHVKATSAALFFYGLWYGEYPYQQITVVDPAWGARAAGGMEYPTLFTCGTSLGTTEDMHSPEGVTVHEAGHQFFYGLVGNNEAESSWLDEGLNSYTDSEVMRRVYGDKRLTSSYGGKVRAFRVDGLRRAPLPSLEGPIGALALQSIPLGTYDKVGKLELKPLAPSAFMSYWRDLPGVHFASQWNDPRMDSRAGYLRSPDSDPIDRTAYLYLDRASYSANSYRRTATVLNALRGLVGEVPFLRGMRHYSDRWRYRHPTPEDFFLAFQEGAALEEDIGWFFEDLFQSTKTGDWILSVEQRRADKPLGRYFTEEDGEPVLIGSDAGGDKSGDGTDSEIDADEGAEQPWLTNITLRVRGALRMPVKLVLKFENGETQTHEWTRAEQIEYPWKRWELSPKSKLISAQLDPDWLCPVDLDRSNNSWFEKRDTLSSYRWGERALSQTARYLQWYSRFGG